MRKQVVGALRGRLEVENIVIIFEQVLHFRTGSFFVFRSRVVFVPDSRSGIRGPQNISMVILQRDHGDIKENSIKESNIEPER
jgi:hypothetical protein